MSNAFTGNLLRTLGVLGVLLFIPPGVEASGPNERIDISATLGFAETFRLGHWAPLTVTISNEGQHLEAELQVTLTYRDAFNDGVFTKTHRRSLDLSSNSRKRFRFTVFVETFAVPLRIQVVAGGRELARHSVDLRRRFTVASLVLVVSRNANIDYLNDSTGKRLRVVYPHPELLPDHWQGYDGAAAMIVHGVSLESLNRRQFEALKKWLAQGGRLAVSGGPDYSLLRKPRLAELLPAAPAGLQTIAEPSVLDPGAGEPLSVQAPFHVHRLIANRGRVLYRLGDAPLVVEQPYGRGFVSYLSFDVASPPFDRWAGIRNLLGTVLRLESESAPLARRQMRKPSPVPDMLDRPEGSDYDQGVMLMFLVLYLGALATIYRFQPVSRKGQRIAPALLVACPLLFAPAAYWLFGSLLFPTPASVVIASVIEPFASGPYARLKVDLGVYSKQRRKLQLDIDAPQPGLLANYREPRWGVTASYSVDESSGRAIEIPNLRSYVLHMVQADDVIAYDVKVSATRNAGGIQLSIHNHTGQSWQDAWLVHGHNVYRLGPVTHNDGSPLTLHADTVQTEFGDEPWQRIFSEPGEPASSAEHLARTVLVTALDRLADDLGSTEVLLAAIVPSPLRLGQANASWRQEAAAVAVFRFELARTAGDDVAS